jgi:hypothetical protein
MEINEISDLKTLLKEEGYSQKATEEIAKWYSSSPAIF